MFGYSCDYCGRGVIRLRYFKNYKARLKDVIWTIPRAKIGVCDVCAGRCYSAKEYKRWQKLKPK
jgi:hypothetical protein